MHFQKFTNLYSATFGEQPPSVKCLKALKENEHVEDLESEFDSKDWKSSGYSSTEDDPYKPHLGVSKRTFRVTSDENSEDKRNRKLSD